MISEESAESARVYGATAARYVEHNGTQISGAVETPLDRAIIWAFAEELLGDATPDGLVADLGCGPGRAAAFFSGQGLDAVGFDLAPGMIEVARQVHPHLRFEVAPLTDVPLEGETLAGAVCWYSIIHTPTDALPQVWRELHRLLQPGGQVLLAFQAGNGERIERPDASLRATRSSICFMTLRSSLPRSRPVASRSSRSPLAPRRRHMKRRRKRSSRPGSPEPSCQTTPEFSCSKEFGNTTAPPGVGSLVRSNLHQLESDHV